VKVVLLLTVILIVPVGAQAQPRYQGLGKVEIEIANQRLQQAKPSIRALIKNLETRVTIKPSRCSLGGGYYTESVLGSGPKRYVVYLRRQSLRSQSPYYRHMFWHELGHVLINAYFSPVQFRRTISLLEQSQEWMNCFPDQTNPLPDSCVPEEEIVADQLAFWITGKHRVRSPRQVPVLFTYDKFRDLVIAQITKRALARKAKI
jgi:hypothetical protein